MANTTPSNDELKSQLLAALGAPVPQYYANGFGIATNATDVNVLLRTGEKNVAVVTVTYPMLKSLSLALSDALRDYEAAVGDKVKSVQEIQASLEAIAEAKR